VSERILTASDVEAIARKVVEIVDARSTTFGFVDARELAEELGVSIDYVYSHATELGAMRLGSGPKARIRFRSRSACQARGACDAESRLGKRVRPHRPMTQIAISPGRVVRILCRLQFKLRDCWIGGFWQRGHLRRSGRSEPAPREELW
jgi:hypothetical protein